MKHFPWEFEEKKPILLYPEEANLSDGDILEIGPGRGDLLLAMASDLPDKQFIAIELGKKRFAKLINRRDNRRLDNIQLICADARIVLKKFYREAKFEKIYVLFPDPWPKFKHEPKRLLNRDFLSLLTKRLLPGGDLYMATDVHWYAEWAIDNADSIKEIENRGHPFTTAEALYKYTPTFFEQKWRFEGRDIFYMHYRKKSE